MPAFTYSGTASNRDDRITVLEAVQELTQDEQVVLAVKNAMDSIGDGVIDVVLTGTVAAFNTAAQINVKVTPRQLILVVAESERSTETVSMFFGDFIMSEGLRVAESLTVVRA
jgi:hypothetical protein